MSRPSVCLLPLLLVGCARGGFGSAPGELGVWDQTLPVERGVETAPSETGAPDRTPPKPGSDGAPGERCENGVDDNGNGLVDCEDPACAAYECVDLPPAGTVNLLRGVKGPFPPTSPVPACEVGSAQRLYVEPPTVSCAPCACAAKPGAACSAPTIKLWDQGGCNLGNSYDKTLLLAKQGGCTAGLPTLLSAAVTAPSSPQVTCQAGGGTVSPAFAGTVDACATTVFGKGCPAGQGCVRRTAAPLPYGPCYRSTGTSCPQGLNKLAGHLDFVDSRTCSPCSCSLGKQPCVGGSYTFFGCTGCPTACQQLQLGYGTPSVCLELAPFDGSYSVSYSPPQVSSSACSPSGGQAAGSLSLSPAIVLCCVGTK